MQEAWGLEFPSNSEFLAGMNIQTACECDAGVATTGRVEDKSGAKCTYI